MSNWQRLVLKKLSTGLQLFTNALCIKSHSCVFLPICSYSLLMKYLISGQIGSKLYSTLCTTLFIPGFIILLKPSFSMSSLYEYGQSCVTRSCSYFSSTSSSEPSTKNSRSFILLRALEILFSYFLFEELMQNSCSYLKICVNFLALMSFYNNLLFQSTFALTLKTLKSFFTASLSKGILWFFIYPLTTCKIFETFYLFISSIFIAANSASCSISDSSAIVSSLLLFIVSFFAKAFLN